MNIVFCSAEVVPFAKTGGLADVAGALPPALERLGHEVVVFMPKYKTMAATQLEKDAATGLSYATIGKNVRVYLIEQADYFGRDGIYGDKKGDYKDNLDRYTFYCHEVFRLLKVLNFKADIVHCHDWHAALIPVLLKTKFHKDALFKGTKAIFTIHNLAYQGVFPKSEFPKLGVDPHLYQMHGFEFYDQLNVMKAGIIFSDRVTTVSPQYAKEIQTRDFGCGLEGVLRHHPEDIAGILNGLDYTIWNPETDELLETPFSAQEIEKKAVNKAAVQRSLGFDVNPDIPLMGFVGRLCHQKGLDLTVEALSDLAKLNVQIAFVGVGEQKYHHMIEECAKKNPMKVAHYLKFEERMAHRMYAACDLFLMPSVYEPCGLGQMIALRYGAVPIVFHTGGLADTIAPYDPRNQQGNGFVFYSYRREALAGTVAHATEVYKDRENFHSLILRALRSRFLWNTAAEQYQQVYRQCLS